MGENLHSYSQKVFVFVQGVCFLLSTWCFNHHMLRVRMKVEEVSSSQAHGDFPDGECSDPVGSTSVFEANRPVGQPVMSHT